MLDWQGEKLLLIPMEDGVHMEVVLSLEKTTLKWTDLLHMLPGFYLNLYIYF